MDAEHRVGAGVDLVDRPAVGAVIGAVAVAIHGAIFARHRVEVARHALADAEAIAAEHAVDQRADAAAAFADDLLIRSALAVIAGGRAIGGHAGAIGAVGAVVIAIALVAVPGAAIGVAHVLPDRPDSPLQIEALAFGQAVIGQALLHAGEVVELAAEAIGFAGIDRPGADSGVEPLMKLADADVVGIVHAILAGDGAVGGGIILGGRRGGRAERRSGGGQQKHLPHGYSPHHAPHELSRRVLTHVSGEGFPLRTQRPSSTRAWVAIWASIGAVVTEAVRARSTVRRNCSIRGPWLATHLSTTPLGSSDLRRSRNSSRSCSKSRARPAVSSRSHWSRASKWLAAFCAQSSPSASPSLV